MKKELEKHVLIPKMKPDTKVIDILVGILQKKDTRLKENSFLVLFILLNAEVLHLFNYFYEIQKKT